MKNLNIKLENFFSHLDIADAIDEEAIKKCQKLYLSDKIPIELNSESDDIQFDYLGLMPYVLEHYGDEIRDNAEKSLMKQIIKNLYENI